MNKPFINFIKRYTSIAPRSPTLCAYPKDSLYPELFYKALSKHDVKVIQGEIGFRWLLRNHRLFDLLHFHWPEFYYDARRLTSVCRFFFFLTLAKLLRNKIVWTVHNLFPHHVIRVRNIDYLCRSIMIFFSNLLFVHGETSKNLVTREFPFIKKFKLCKIEHGNYLGYYPNEIGNIEARRKLGLSHSDFVYLTLGRANPYKGIDDLIDAYKLTTNGQDKLIIAGYFPNSGYLEMVRLKIQDAGPSAKNIRLVDRRIEDIEIQLYLNAADVMVLPYKYRSVLTSGIALLALSFGLPIIAPNIGNLADVVNDENIGLLYENSPSNSGLCHSMRQVREMRFDRTTIIDRAKRYEWDGVAQTAYESFRALFPG